MFIVGACLKRRNGCLVEGMHITPIDEHIHLLELELDGIKNFIAGYVLKGKKVAIVETGPRSTVDSWLFGLKALKIEPEEVVYVAVSHIHLDHSGGVGTLLRQLPNAKVVVHHRGSAHIANPENLWAQSKKALGKLVQTYRRPERVPKEKIVAATDGMTFDLGHNVALKAIETLGHASHHLSFLETAGQGIFVGDAAGIYLSEYDVVVPTTPPPHRLDMTLKSLRRLINLRPKFLLYSHFGKVNSPQEKLRAYSKQLKLWAEVAAVGLAKNEDVKAISRRILRRDETLRMVEEYIRSHRILNETVLHLSVEGVTKYLEKFGLMF